MRTLLPPIGLGAVTSVLLYAVLAVADPSASNDNPWYQHFLASNPDTHLRATMDNVNRRIAVIEWRGQLRGPDFSDAQIVALLVGSVPIQIVEFSSVEAAGKAQALPHNKTCHVTRTGRRMCIIGQVVTQPIPRRTRKPKEAEIREILRVFNDRAEQMP